MAAEYKGRKQDKDASRPGGKFGKASRRKDKPKRKQGPSANGPQGRRGAMAPPTPAAMPIGPPGPPMGMAGPAMPIFPGA